MSRASDRNVLQFTKEVLEERVLVTEESLVWARNNMHKYEPNTVQHERWLNLMMHIADQIVDLKETVEFAPNESQGIKKAADQSGQEASALYDL